MAEGDLWTHRFELVTNAVGPRPYSHGVARAAAVQYACTECGTATGRWLGRCPGCGEWGTLVEEARQVTIPLQVLLQWDDEGNDRQSALDLFDAFGSKEKTLHANLGGHAGVPQFEGEEGNRFFARHLK